MAIPNKWFYKHTVLGKRGEPFIQYKIKTMRDGTDDLFEIFSENNGINEFGKPNNDPRLIPSRKWLRKYHIDEIPQILRLFTGEMKLVGIRPKQSKRWGSYPDTFKTRSLESRPGLFAVEYGLDDCLSFPDTVEGMEEYLDRYEKSPVSADILYLAKILRNKIFRGMHSC